MTGVTPLSGMPSQSSVGLAYFGIAVVADPGGQVDLAQRHVGGRAVSGGNGIPDQHAVLREVRHIHPGAVGGDGNRRLHVGGVTQRCCFA